MRDVEIRIASESWEFDEIHRFNHQTFAEEIPQHPVNGTRRLVDRFHDQNTYIVAVRGRRVIGMVVVRGRRPFSLDQRLANLDSYLPSGRSVCELRLLAVDKASRATGFLPPLLDYTARHCLREGFDLAVISAITTQLRLYRHIGFEPFGPLTGTAPVQFQPMMLTLERFAARLPASFQRAGVTARQPSSFLPGPVAVQPAVRAAFARSPESHRLPAFEHLLTSTRDRLCRLAGARHAAVLLGSGTTANDVVAAQLSLRSSPGVILSNGEFGERLQDHARRWNLAFDVISTAWGEAFDVDSIRNHVANAPRGGWLWCVHCETSTGVLNDLDAISSVCAEARVALCVDAVSSIGTVPVDLERVSLASAVSGKGLGAYPGLAIVFHDTTVDPAPQLPRTLDLGLYGAMSVPFTHSSNLVSALQAALTETDWEQRYRELRETGIWLRTLLERLGFRIVAAASSASPAVITIALPPQVASTRVAAALEHAGFSLSAHSRYLAQRNWIQICPMGGASRSDLSSVVTALAHVCHRVSGGAFASGASVSA